MRAAAFAASCLVIGCVAGFAGWWKTGLALIAGGTLVGFSAAVDGDRDGRERVAALVVGLLGVVMFLAGSLLAVLGLWFWVQQR